jgi:hypothetical protein
MMKAKYLLSVAALLLATSVQAGTAPSFFAVVDKDGTLARGYRAVSVKHLSDGTYVVNFNHDVTACSYTASVGLSGTAGSESAGTVHVAGRASHPKSIFVRTYDMQNNLSDRGFHVIVAC